jgi:hypothetical protein
MKVYACICIQQVAGVMETLCMVGICMYLHVYACILTVHDRVTVNTAAKFPATVLQWTKRQQGHTGTLFFGNSETLFIAHFSGGILLVVNWPNHGPEVDVEQGASLARALTIAHAQRIARSLAAVHVPGNGAIVPGWD